jgi:putative SOS response-associated peptidase YedK
MCGKFTQMASWARLVRLADIIAAADGPVETATPMRFATIITLDETGSRTAVRMRWGLVPPGTNDPRAIKPHIHARAETVDTKPTFREAFARRRGLLAVRSFNEGRELPNGKTEQHIITPRDGRPLAIAAIWERWSAPDTPALLSFAMVTVAANALIGTITDRMPAIVQPDDWAKWLGEEPASLAELKAMLVSIEGDWDMQAAARAKPPAPKKPSAQADLF